MRQKIIFCTPSGTGDPAISHRDVDSYLSDGWIVVSVTAQHCAISAGNGTYSAGKVYGGFMVVIQKSE